MNIAPTILILCQAAAHEAFLKRLLEYCLQIDSIPTELRAPLAETIQSYKVQVILLFYFTYNYFYY